MLADDGGLPLWSKIITFLLSLKNYGSVNFVFIFSSELPQVSGLGNKKKEQPENEVLT